jgi:hypothetical protein
MRRTEHCTALNVEFASAYIQFNHNFSKFDAIQAAIVVEELMTIASWTLHFWY